MVHSIQSKCKFSDMASNGRTERSVYGSVAISHCKVAGDSARRRGLTVVECLFAMTIILVGLFGMSFMVRFAGRQAVDSYKITQGLATGDNAVAFAHSGQVFQPSMGQPWQMIDDGTGTPTDSSGYFFGSMERLHSYRFSIGNPSAMTPQLRARFANAVLGTGFCLDPFFWGSQTRYGSKLTERAWDNLRRASFPFYNENYPSNFDPFGSYASGNTSYSPRLARISLRDPSPDLTGNNGWLKLPASRKLAQISGGDVATAVPEQDRSSGPIRDIVASSVDGSLLASLQGGEANSNTTWFSTIVPSDETAVVEPSMVAPPASGLPFFPELYELSVVVVAKRDVREIAFSDASAAYAAFKADGTPPASERLMSVSFPNLSEAQSSGTFEIQLSADASVSANMRVGDWLMLSRETYMEPVDDVQSRRSRHKWYRVIGVSDPAYQVGPLGNQIFTREVRVSGAPWALTLNEYEKIQRRLASAGPTYTPPAFPQTVATLIPNVINVYQRTYKVAN